MMSCQSLSLCLLLSYSAAMMAMETGSAAQASVVGKATEQKPILIDSVIMQAKITELVALFPTAEIYCLTPEELKARNTHIFKIRTKPEGLSEKQTAALQDEKQETLAIIFRKERHTERDLAFFSKKSTSPTNPTFAIACFGLMFPGVPLVMIGERKLIACDPASGDWFHTEQ